MAHTCRTSTVDLHEFPPNRYREASTPGGVIDGGKAGAACPAAEDIRLHTGEARPSPRRRALDSRPLGNAETEPQPWLRPKLARALRISDDQLQELLDDVTVIKQQPIERMAYALQNPGSADMFVVAYLHERLRQLDESYDQSSSTTLLGPAGQVHGQVKFLRERATNPRVRRALHKVEADSATLMGQLVWDVSQRRDHQAPLTYFAEP